MKKAAPFMKKIKDDLASYLNKKQMLIKAYAGTASELAAYEDNNLLYHVDTDVARLVVTSQEQGNLIESLKHTVENLRNPFTDLYHWTKGEIYDLSAFTVAMMELNNTKTGVDSVKKKIAQSKKDIESIQAGKKTMSTVFKNTGDVHKIQSSIETYERDLIAQEKLLDVQYVYLGRTILPKFKEEKMRLYSRIVQ